MERLGKVWPERRIDSETKNAYWLALNDLDDAEFVHAITKITAEADWFPRPAEIRRAAGVPSRSERRGALREKYAAFFRSMGFDVPERGSFVIPSNVTRLQAGDRPAPDSA